MKLAELLKEEKDRINVYAIILDCSAPYYSENSDKYICTLKIIDESVNSGLTGKHLPEFLTVTMFAKTAGELPRPTKIGSVIRIHRGQTKKNKAAFQMNCDVNIKGAWVLFDPTDSVTPLAKSGKSYTFIATDKTALKDIRAFGKKYFAENALKSISLAKAAKDKPTDFDALCIALEIKAKKGVTRVTLCDANKVAKLYLQNSREIFFNPHEVVRLRSANYEDGSDDHLKFSDYSNIMRVSVESKSAKALLDEVKGKKVSEEVKKALRFYTTNVPDSQAVSKILDPRKQTKPVQLKELISGEVTKSGQRFFRVNAKVIEIGPKDPQDWLCVVEKKTEKRYEVSYRRL